MDRTMYGKMEPGHLQAPFRLTLKNGCESPGYALLADLQNTVPGGGVHHNINNKTTASAGYGSLNPPRQVITSPHTVQPLSSYQSHSREGSYGSSAYGTTGGLKSPGSPRSQHKVLPHPHPGIASQQHQASSYSQHQSSQSQHQGFSQSQHHSSSQTQHQGLGQHQHQGLGQTQHQPHSNLGQSQNQGLPHHQQHQEHKVYHEAASSNTVSPGGTSQRPGARANTPSVQNPQQGGVSSNLSELDSLLQDLSNAHYASVYDKNRSMNGGVSPIYATPNGTPGARGSLERPTVDSLLEELSAAAPIANSTMNHYANGDSLPRPGRQVTITVRETTTEPVYASTQPQVSQNQLQQQQQYNRNANEEVIRSAQFSETKRAPNTQGKAVLSERLTTHMTRHIEGAPAASSATRELDDLMASLSDFKINAGTHQHQTVTESPFIKSQQTTSSTTATTVHRDQLDSMLGNLQADMSRQGVNTAQKGCCGACDKAIVGQVITALGKTWHPEHFVCTHCNQELGTRNFFERDGHPYCEPDYHNLFSPRCAYCNGPILDKCVTALEKTWHTEHFFCAQCGKQFGEDGFHEREGKPYCRDDYFDMFAPKCGGCNRPIMENYISALNSQWHPDCFVCRDCRQPFHHGSFFDHDGLPYCETHYHAKRGSLCAGCHKPIAGRCITAMFRKFHPEHFVCAYCLKQLNKGTFKEQNDKPYCHNCFDKLYG